jgi:phospholipase C
MRTRSLTCVMGFCVVALGLVACNGAGPGGGNLPVNVTSEKHLRHRSGSSSPIQHVVLLIQENRSFNDLFATFPGGDGTTTGYALTNTSCSPPIYAGPIALSEEPLLVPKDLVHRWYDGYQIAFDGGNMDAFDDVPYVNGSSDECSSPYQYTDPSDIQPYWTLASQYALAEHMFTTQGSDSFTAHQDLIRGGTIVEPNKAMIDIPSDGSNWWGCDAPKGTKTNLINKGGTKYYKRTGPFPCSDKFKSSYKTLRDLLDAKSISWKYYVPNPKTQINGKLLSAFDVIAPVRCGPSGSATCGPRSSPGPEWTNNVVSPETEVLNDVQNGNLAQVSWVIPDGNNSDHPGETYDYGPEWIATVVNAIGESQYWDSTAIVIVWDDWGGFYDNEGAASALMYGGPGERVPAIVVSPYAKPGYISATNYQFGSILKYIENNWNLGSLDTTDKTSNSIIDCFDYSQTPITFQPIASSLGRAYFMHEKRSPRAPDDDW